MSRKRQKQGRPRNTDLSAVEPSKLEGRMRELQSTRSQLHYEINAMRDEQQSLRLLSTVMVGESIDLGGFSAERRDEFENIRQRQIMVDELRKTRDLINGHIILPEQAILENLYMYYFRLTGEETDLRYPSLKKEIEMFRRFFELQSMYFRKVKGTEIHMEYQKTVKEQIAAIKNIEQELQQDKALKTITKSPSETIGPLEFKIKKINGKLQRKRRKMRNVKNELGRIEAFIGTGGSRRKMKRNMPDFSQVQEKISAGESLSLDDLGALLKRGNVDEIVTSSDTDTKKKITKSSSPRRSKVKTRRGNRRGGPRTLDHKER